MDASEDAVMCRLCGTDLREGKCKNIFDGSSDLINKIKETLPISISVDDNGSKYICLPCYDKIILYNKFVQDVAEHSKKSDSLPKMKSLFDLSNEMTEFSKVYSDAVYTCPNCNVDLMILLVNSSQGCDYTFQISLAMVNHSDENRPKREKSVQLHKTVMNSNRSKKNGLKDENELTNAEAGVDITNQVSFMLPVLQQDENINYDDTSSNRECLKSEIQEKVERKDECVSYDRFTASPKILRSEEAQCASENDLTNHDDDSADQLARIHCENDNACWPDSETDCKSERDAFTTESQDVIFEENYDQDENDIYKSCLKYVCKLCGARYLSHLKYEFHMERHKVGKISKYECTVCEKETSSEKLLWDHYFHTHKSLQRYICMECGKLYVKRSRLNGHQKIYKHSGVKQIQVDIGENTIIDDTVQNVATPTKQDEISVNCSLCGKLISDLDPDAINDLVTCANCEDSTLSLMVDGNETKVISPRQYHCSKCPKHFVRKERLEFHEMRHNENMNEFVCSTCGKEFRAENSLYEHYLFVHKGARPHICELCGKSFQLKARLKEHHRIHTGERPYQCDVCGQRCRTMNALKLHRKIHFSHSRYNCNICNKSFSKKQNMNEHLEKHWKNDKTVALPQLFTCPICLEDFPTYRMLKYHMMEVHKVSKQDPLLTVQKPWYECSECHEKFKHQMSLKAHKARVHEGIMNQIYQCDICDVTYKVKQLLVNHIKSKHNGERRYKCAQCEKGFNDTKSLYNHVLLHTGKKPFVCEYCNMSFRRKDSRDHHRRKHTGEQPYQCPDCGESFSTYNNRSKHRKKEHGKGDPECPDCGEKCTSQQEVRIHLNKHLGEKLKKLQGVKSKEI